MMEQFSVRAAVCTKYNLLQLALKGIIDRHLAESQAPTHVFS